VPPIALDMFSASFLAIIFLVTHACLFVKLSLCINPFPSSYQCDTLVFIKACKPFQYSITRTGVSLPAQQIIGLECCSG
jgi:hypothetical protein